MPEQELVVLPMKPEDGQYTKDEWESAVAALKVHGRRLNGRLLRVAAVVETRHGVDLHLEEV